MPNRIIKESICRSESIDQLSWFEEVFFYRLIVNCDDYGRFDARPKILKSALFPLKDGITLKQIIDALNKLSTVGMVQVYEYDQKPYLQLMTWELHQQIRAKRSKYPPMMESDINCNQVIANVPVIQSNPIRIQSESESCICGTSPPQKRFIPPTLDEVKAYCQERKNSVDPERFIDHYTANGWVRGKTKIKDWKACVRTWEKGNKSYQTPGKLDNRMDNRTNHEQRSYDNDFYNKLINNP
jgi:hypothetical protein